MLAAVEAYFLSALGPALAGGTQLIAGPSLGPPDAGARLVEVSAFRLAILPGGDAAEGRRPAFFTRIHRFAADGAARDFDLPEGEAGEVVEVESPPGKPARRGDD